MSQPHPRWGPGDHHPQPYANQPPPGIEFGASVTVRKNWAGRILLIVLGVFALLCVGGTVIVALAGSNTPADTAQDTANRAAVGPVASSTSPQSSAPSTAPTSKPAAAAPTKVKPAPVVISDGTYRVGEDIPPGRYKVVERASGNCWWSISKNGQYSDSGLGGGFPQFTATNGQDVDIMGCPDFQRLSK